MNCISLELNQLSCLNSISQTFATSWGYPPPPRWHHPPLKVVSIHLSTAPWISFYQRNGLQYFDLVESNFELIISSIYLRETFWEANKLAPNELLERDSSRIPTLQFDQFWSVFKLHYVKQTENRHKEVTEILYCKNSLFLYHFHVWDYLQCENSLLSFTSLEGYWQMPDREQYILQHF